MSGQDIVSKQLLIDKDLVKIFTKHFEVDSESKKDNPGYLAWATMAIEVSVKIANILFAIKKPESGRTLRGFQDLVYGLNANDFWAKNSPVLTPLLVSILNAHSDSLNLLLEQKRNQEYGGYDSLLASCRSLPLEIFSMILYLVGGPLLMATSSTPLKLDLMPYFMD